MKRLALIVVLYFVIAFGTGCGDTIGYDEGSAQCLADGGPNGWNKK